MHNQQQVHTMSVIALGFSRMNGKSKDSGNAYDMCRLQIVLPHTGAQTASMQRVAAGFQSAELEIDSSTWARFVSLPYPSCLNVEYVEEMVPFKGKVEMRRKLVGATVAYEISLNRPAAPSPVPAPAAAQKVPA